MTSSDAVASGNADRDLAIAFAEAICDPAWRPFLIDADGRKVDGRVSIEAAVDSGLAYAVPPRERIIAIDLDDEEDHVWSQRLRENLPARWATVECESGSCGHGHLWVVASPGWLNVEIRAECERRAGDHPRGQIRHKADTRPPLSPHRSGVSRSKVVGDAASALAVFQSVAVKALPARSEAWLCATSEEQLVRRHGRPSRGLTLGRLADSAVAAGWDFLRFQSNLQSARAGLLREKYEEQPERNREAYLKDVWERAREFIKHNPPALTGEAARGHIVALRATLPGVGTSCTGSSDRAVYAALLDLAEKVGSVTVGAGVRQLSELSGLSQDGVRGALRRLETTRRIERLPAEERAHARRYRLLAASGAESKVCVVQGTRPLGPPRMVECLEEQTLLADLFTNGSGLGLSARETWEALPTDSWAKVKQIQESRPGALKAPTVRTHLRTLRTYGLAVNDGQQWQRLVPSLDNLERLASNLGVKNKGANRAARHENQRRAFREAMGIAR